MELKRYSPENLRVQDKSPSMLETLLLSIMNGTLSPDGRKSVEDNLNEQETISAEREANQRALLEAMAMKLRGGPPPIRGWKGEVYNNVDSYAKNQPDEIRRAY